MSGIKKLAGQTLWYGIPTIASRFLGYLMNMALPFFIALPEKTADLVQVYTIIPFLNVLYAYGLETAYFRFSQTHDKQKLYNTLSLSLLFSSIFFTVLLVLCKDVLVSATDLQEHPDYILWMAAIIAVDNLNTLPFAKLRQENRPRRYAFARVMGIVINLFVVIFFLGIVPVMVRSNPDHFLQFIYNKDFGLGYYLLGNLCGSLFTLLILSKEIKQVRFHFDTRLWKEVMRYSAPLIIVGLGGMINDVLSRLIYRHVVDLPMQQANHELGIFANIFRIALLITIMIQAFRMAAEPFFFNNSKDENAQKTYARVMKFFVIACCFMFLFIGLFLDVFRWIFTTFADPRWAEGLEVVPLLALGNIFLGIYYNLSVWYKLTDKNTYGAVITVAGAVITIVLNIVLIPVMHYTGAAIATFSCYLFMMISSYLLGQKYYPVPYAVKKLIAYLTLVVLIYLVHLGLLKFISGSLIFSISTGLLLFILFAWFVARIEAKELAKLPVVGKYFNR
ncbi:MAG: polysaccharide biosynthesis C-terminal domain-containing protein [Ferruginibacter sp.]|nr:polysaccharide biosynthesis C-terminal domain-containing protein [Chitinophagaceae bacterium]MBP6286019.1 polysaccharide biosynthesis C-terminal domain-containing protein [Ferruginibacter sp.]MBU9935096.1 polysaccharide biosynthesis C-terminal domain-containing protein [Ferruginibacter sp.]HQY11684.1 polysaccharide biosynthesis C-terminal domain-containing protein [Ferruginibacter sp.]